MAPVAQNGQAARQELERVLSSTSFARSDGLSRLLRFLVERQLEGKAGELKESLIGVEVYGRKPDYDPKLDSTVRSEAVRLRARLRQYYLTEGSHDPLVIELPKGGYVPSFRQRNQTLAVHASRPKRLWIAVGMGILAITTVALVWFVLHKRAPIRIAVLPLVNLNQDSALDYLADGLTGEIIRNLSIIDGLEVRSQTSSFTFKGKPRNVHEASRLLEADYILEGSVLRSGEHLRINAQLVRARDDISMWSGRYDRELTDILSIQDEISRGIVNGLRLKLGRGRRRYETSAEAYDLYLRAQALAALRFNADAEMSDAFEKAIAQDPSFAPAYAGLAAAYAWKTFVGPGNPARVDELATMRAAAERALQLDPLLPEAHSALGIAYARDGQWEQSEKSLRRAIEIAPNLAMVHGNLSQFFLLPLGRIEEAVREERMEVRLDPLSPPARYRLADALITAGRYDEAAAQCEKLPADFFYANVCLGRARVGQGRTADAIRGLATASDWGFLAFAYAKAGQRNEAEKLVIDGPILHPANRGPFQRAVAFAGLEDRDRTVDALEQMADFGPVRIGFTLNGPEFAFVRGDPRVKTLRKKVGLPE